MARPRSPNRDKAFQLWLESGKKRQLKDIAAELQVSEEQVRKWKNQDKWDKVTLPKRNGNVTNQSKGNVTKRKRGGHQGECNETEQDVEQVIENEDLTDKQRLFCLHYVRCFNATKAYQKAYECDYVSAMQNGSRMLRNDKVKEEIAEVSDAIASGDRDDIEAEMGDLLFSVINAARLYKVNPENALERTNRKFIDRFNYIEAEAAASGRHIRDLSLDEMEALWQQAKTSTKKS